MQLEVGATRQFASVVRDAAGTVLTGRVVAWTTDDPTIATVSAGGLVTALRPGPATIRATSEGVSGGATVVIAPRTPVPVDRIEVTPAQFALEVGCTRQLTAVMRDAAGNVLADRVVTWKSENTFVAIVSVTGAVTAVSSGTTTIVATSEGKTSRVAVTVPTPPMTEYRLLLVNGTPVPRTVFTTTETGADGVTRTVRWDAYDGAFRLGGGRYEQVVEYWVFREGSPAVQEAYVYRGTFLYDVLDGGIVFHPSDGSPSFRGYAIDGALLVARRLLPGTPELTLLYRLP